MRNMKKNKVYNSALDANNKDLDKGECRWYCREDLRGSVEHLNIIHDLPVLSYLSDVVYSEPAWRNGYEKFSKKAKEPVSSFEDYMMMLVHRVILNKKPAFIVAGRESNDYFDETYFDRFPILLNGGRAMVYVYMNVEYSGECETTDELTDWLSDRYDCCMDFCCGYGEHLFKFDKFVASDINDKCLGYIKWRLENESII